MNLFELIVVSRDSANKGNKQQNCMFYKDLATKWGQMLLEGVGMGTIMSPCACLYVKSIILCLCTHIFVNNIFLI